jgi:hypothetical protein
MLLYFILGSPSAEKEVVVSQLITEGFTEEETILLLIPEAARSSAETPLLQSCDYKKTHPKVVVEYWNAEQKPLIVSHYRFKNYSAVFLFVSDHHNLIDQLEYLSEWTLENSLIVSRILTVVDCSAFLLDSKLFPWIEACIHFSDTVLLNKTAGVESKALESFVTYFKDNHYQCLFYKLHPKKPLNSQEILYPEARRLSLAFDILDISDSDDEEVVKDLYFECNHLGQRLKKLPNIVAHL